MNDTKKPIKVNKGTIIFFWILIVGMAFFTLGQVNVWGIYLFLVFSLPVSLIFLAVLLDKF